MGKSLNVAIHNYWSFQHIFVASLPAEADVTIGLEKWEMSVAYRGLWKVCYHLTPPGKLSW